MLTEEQCVIARRLLEELGRAIRGEVLHARTRMVEESMTDIVAVTEADTIYRIDKVTEESIIGWLEEYWPQTLACEVVMEGLEEELILPRGLEPQATLILDPIDGTRGLMYDKRPAWALAGLAPYRGGKATLQDIQVAVMTELPPIKQRMADQLSAVRGQGVRAKRRLLDEQTEFPLLRTGPSSAKDFAHGFASLAKFFPQGKALIAAIEEDLWSQIFGGQAEAPLVFDDQYLSTGGQIYELAMGRDRMIGDIRPLVFRKLGLISSLSCHPYDICTALVLTELGGIVETPGGRPVDAPLDTTSPVAWVGYANEELAKQARPALRRALERHLGAAD